MRKLIASINMTLDGYCDHTQMIADEELHDHYTDLLKRGGDLLYGRITYQLMENYWPELVKNPSGDKSLDEFARAIQDISKVVFSRTLKTVTWENSRLATKSLEEEVAALKRDSSGGGGKDIFVGSPGLIAQLTQRKLIDEYQLCVHPVIAGSGLRLFKEMDESMTLRLVKTKTFRSGAILHYHVPVRK